jgi:glutaredoxin
MGVLVIAGTYAFMERQKIHNAWQTFQHERQIARLHPDDPRRTTGNDQIVVLVADWCSVCRRLQSDLWRARIRFRPVDVDTADGKRAMQAVRARGVPVIIIGQSVIHGYDTLALDEKLSPLGYDIYKKK